jgi:hypothetical protein
MSTTISSPEPLHALEPASATNRAERFSARAERVRAHRDMVVAALEKLSVPHPHVS